MFDVFVQQLTWESDDVLGVVLERVDGMPLPAWAPGAHIGIHLPVGVRHYSLCGDPADSRRYRVLILREEDGRGGSSFVHGDLRPGHVLQITEPANHFPLEPADGYRFVAGGIGITPISAMMTAVRATGSSRASLLYVGRSRFTMAMLDEIADDAGVTVVPRDELARPDLAAYLADPTRAERVYVCGPPAMVDATRSAAIAAGWDETAIHAERFVPVELDRDGEVPFGIELARTGITASVARGRSVVEVLEDAGIELDSACREGICGTCRVPVLSGEIVHRDAILSDAERACGDAMMACVSRGRGIVVLDL